jgi:hypothetical protein
MTGGPLAIEIRGLDQIRANLRNLYEKAPAEFGQAIGEELNDAMMESQAECPYDFENTHMGKNDDGRHLRDTALLEGPIKEGGNLAFYASYDKLYASIVHENPNVRHHWPTKWKFLEDPLTRRVSMLRTSLQIRFDQIIGNVLMRVSFSNEEDTQRDYNSWLHGTVGGRNTARSWGKSIHSGSAYPIKPGDNK